METYNNIIKIIDVNIIFCLIPLLVTLILVGLIFKNRFQTKRVLNLIRWFIISYSAMNLIYFLIGMIMIPEKFAFFNRATGPYWWAYWFMLLSSSVLPFTLLYKRLALKPLYLLFVAFFMKIGMYFERFVIIVTSFHRDYLPPYNDDYATSFDFPMALMILTLQGFILAILLLGIFELIERKTTTRKINLSAK